ncbi:MAG: YfdX family protein [Bdellovibrionaceae bacterium]|nr:YfdX family protein [Pseudobdellovibrionaceae bacterium]
MKIKRMLLSFAALGILTNSMFAEGSSLPTNPQSRSSTAEGVQSQVESKQAEKATQLRKKLLAEAALAIDDTKKALAFLDKKNSKEALAALERVTGKLELIISREPGLALAPIDMNVAVQDLLADPDTVKVILKEARDLLGDGEVQKARPLLANLSSEMVFSTINIPLATYPQAIKAVARLIDENMLNEAKTALEAALSTLVVTDVIIPLPVLRAELLLKEAEKLAEKSNRSEKENESLSNQLSEARKQVRLAEVLGYGKKKTYKPIYEQIDQIEKKSRGGKSGRGWFDNIKKKVSELFG